MLFRLRSLKFVCANGYATNVPQKMFESQPRHITDISDHEFYHDRFAEHKNNMCIVSKKFGTLDFKEQLLVKNHFVEGLRHQHPAYTNSTAVQWLLSERNVSKLISTSLSHLHMLEMKQLADIMTICDKYTSDNIVHKVISRMQQLLPDVRDSHDLEMTIKTILAIKSLPSSRWTLIEDIVSYHDLISVEGNSAQYRSTEQDALMFNLLNPTT